jgi:hypothetical protein
MIDNQNYYQYFLRLIIFVKVLYIALAIYSVYVSKFESKDTKKIEELTFFKKRLEILFKGLMALLLIYLFNPIFNTKDNIILDSETRLFLFAFGVLIFLTADWEGIIKNIPKSFQLIQEITGDFHIISS